MFTFKMFIVVVWETSTMVHSIRKLITVMKYTHMLIN